MKIGEFSRQSGCSIQTIRFYEKQKLLPIPMRTEGNFRIYNQSALDHLLFIKRCRNLDITLSEIKQLIGLKAAPDNNCEDVNNLIKNQINVIDNRMSELVLLREHLTSLNNKCSVGNRVENCGILKDLAGEKPL